MFSKCFLIKHPRVNFSRYTAHWVAWTSVVACEKAIKGYSAVKDNFAHIFYLLFVKIYLCPLVQLLSLSPYNCHITFRKYTRGGSKPPNFLRKNAFHFSADGFLSMKLKTDIWVFCCWRIVSLLSVEYSRFYSFLIS